MFAFALIIYRWLLLAFRPLFAAPPGTGSLPSDSTSSSTPVIVPSSASSSNTNNSTDPLATRVAELEEMMRQQASQPRYPTYPKEPKINSPSPFKGNKAEAEEFILKCQSVFDICSRTYHDDQTKLAFVFNVLQGDAISGSNLPCLPLLSRLGSNPGLGSKSNSSRTLPTRMSKKPPDRNSNT